MIGCSLVFPVPSLILFTDASVTGLGGTLEGRHLVFGRFQSTEHINVLEIPAVPLALKHFYKILFKVNL
jgi:hypothetical protein